MTARNPADLAHRAGADDKLPPAARRRGGERPEARRKRVLAHLRRGMPEAARKGLERAEEARGW